MGRLQLLYGWMIALKNSLTAFEQNLECLRPQHLMSMTGQLSGREKSPLKLQRTMIRFMGNPMQRF